jgi:hypothetical protein
MKRIIFLENIVYDQPKKYELCIEIRALLIIFSHILVAAIQSYYYGGYIYNEVATVRCNRLISRIRR